MCWYSSLKRVWAIGENVNKGRLFQTLSVTEVNNINQSINGSICLMHIASPTLHCHPGNPFWQVFMQTPFPSYVIHGRTHWFTKVPIFLGASLAFSTQICPWKIQPCEQVQRLGSMPHTHILTSWQSKTVQVIGLNSVSWSDRWLGTHRTSSILWFREGIYY